MERIPPIYLFLFMCCLTPAALYSQNGSDSLTRKAYPDSLRHYSIDEVTVYGQNQPSRIIPAQELSGKELQRLNALSVADAVRYFSGVQIKDYGGIGGLKTINIRSMGTQHVGVFFDGIQLGNAQNGQIDLGRFSLDNMESISLYNGQKSAVFQPAKDFASAGSIYMQTRTPRFDRDGKNNHFGVSMKTGSFGTANPSILWEHRFNDRLSSSFNVEYLYTTGRYKFSYTKKNGYDTTEVRRNGDVRALRAEGGLFGLVRNGEWKAKVYFYNSERGYPGASVRQEPGRFRHEDRQWDDNFFVQGSFRKTFSPFYSLLLNGKYAYDYLHYLSDPRLDESTMYVNNHYYQQETYLSAANEFTFFKWWKANLAADFQWNTLDADLVDFVYPQRYSVLTAAATSFEFPRVKVQASLLHTYVHDRTEAVGGSAGDKSEFTPTFVVWYKPWSRPELSFRAFYKRIFRMPTLNDLYYTFIGNKYLNPEYTTQYNLCEKFRRHPAADRLPGGRLLQRSGRQDRRHAHQQPVPVDDDQPRSRGNTRDRNDRADQLAVRSGNLQRPAELHLPESPGRHRPDERMVRRPNPLYPVAQRFRRTESRLPGMGSELQLPLHRRTLRIRREHPRKLRAAVVYARHGALEIHPVQKNGAAHHRRSEQHLQPAIRSRTMLPDAGHEF